jgi:hypothetical protein
MNALSPDQVAQLQAEFPGRDVQAAWRQVEAKAASEPVRHPIAYARSILRDMPDSSTPGRKRGTLRPDGSWWSGADHESATDRACRDLHAIILRTLTLPRDAVAMIRNSPLLLAAYRESNLRDMLQFDGTPQPCTGGPYAEMAWCDAAWAGVRTSTPAESMVKQGLIQRWRKILIALYHPDIAAVQALEANTARQYAADDDFDGGNTW